MTMTEARFEFGANWARFLSTLDENRIRVSEEALQQMLGTERLDGKTFIDIGSGSGLSSLAARRLGATVFSFDYDRQSVACTQTLRDRYFENDARWTVEQGSALDADYLARLGKFDVVYSWGVLHHTGQMWDALANVAPLVADGGQLFVAIYNDQGRVSRIWTFIKRLYNALPRALRFLVLWPVALRIWGPLMLRDFLLLRPFRTWRKYSANRGMSPWHDVVDWVGGYPFEVAKPEQIFDFYRAKGFELTRMTTCAGGLGCNQFVFVKTRSAP